MFAQNDKLTIDDLSKVDDANLLDVDVTTASKNQERLSNAPGIITVITSTEIEKFGATNLQEILERVASIYVVGTYLLPNNFISIRGDLSLHYNNHVLILINGRPSRENLFGGIDFPIFASFPIFSIERIEVIRGPGSVLYGTNAYSGVINIITKDIKENKTTISSSYGSFDTKSIEVNNKYFRDDLTLNVGLKYLSQKGWDYYSMGELPSRTATKFDTLSFKAGQDNIGADITLKYKNLSISSFITFSSQAHPGAVPLRVYPTSTGAAQTVRNRRIESLRTFFDVGYDFTISERSKIAVNATYNSMLSKFSTPSGNNVIPTEDLLFEATGFFNPINKVNIVVGATSYILSGKADNGDLSSGVKEYSETWYSSYAQLDFKPTEYLKFIVGGQVNKPANIDIDFVPRLGVIANFTKSIGAKILYGQAFRAPFQFEQSVTDSTVVLGNPDLKPEKIRTIDAQLFYNSNYLQLSATYFNSIQKDLINRRRLDPKLTYDNYLNEFELTSSGIEFETKVTPIDRLFITGSFSYQTNSLNDTIDHYTLVPQKMWKIGAFYSLKHGSSIGVYNSHIGNANKTYSVSGTGVKTDARIANQEAEAFNFMTLDIKVNISKLLYPKVAQSVFLNLYFTNLLNEKIFYPEYARRRINTLPGRSERAFFGRIIYQF
jgi:outer membrane receptor for ferrienterochelin and colicin